MVDTSKAFADVAALALHRATQNTVDLTVLLRSQARHDWISGHWSGWRIYLIDRRILRGNAVHVDIPARLCWHLGWPECCTIKGGLGINR